MNGSGAGMRMQEMSQPIVRRALGNDFAHLHPRLQERHSFSSTDGLYSVGTGVLDKVWHGSKIFVPFLHLGSMRHIMFAQSGTQIPFEIRCFAYQDSFGRETVSLVRMFHFEPPRRFDEYVVEVPQSSTIILYAGTHQHLAVELNFSVSSIGGLLVRSGRQRVRFLGISWRFPLVLSGVAEVHEWYDEASKSFHIDGLIRNRLFGKVFGFAGSFQSEVRRLDDSGIPEGVRPLKENPTW